MGLLLSKWLEVSVIPSFAKAELAKLRNKVKRRSTPAECFEDGRHRDVSFSLAAPLLEQEGWTRPKKMLRSIL